MIKEFGDNAMLREIIPADRLQAFQNDADALAKKVSSLKDTWVCKYPLIARLGLWYYEKKFLRLIKRLKHGR